MAWMLDLGQTGVQCGVHQGLGILGSQFQPGSQPGPVIVGGFLDELDAQVSAIGKAHQQHGFGHPGMLNRIDRPTAEHGIETPDQVLPAMWAGEDVDIVAERGHDLGLRVGVRESHGAAQHLMAAWIPDAAWAR
jgi:hypothetical protein